MDAIDEWIHVIMMYRSQISTFWESQEEVTSELTRVLREWGGIPILQSSQYGV
jgi:hypothetical protein